jgi:hypothetical protein
LSQAVGVECAHDDGEVRVTRWPAVAHGASILGRAIRLRERVPHRSRLCSAVISAAPRAVSAAPDVRYRPVTPTTGIRWAERGALA